MREILISESAWEEMTCLFAPSLDNPLIIEAFGVDIIGNLQALLVDKIYGDLRNQLAHGYVPAGYYNQPPCIFAWWLVLHILMNPTARYWQATYGQGSETQT
ncbi:DUF4209 domain-containing protein [Klebsiella pneumoniae]|uniref:DUF4209 domain-containing protein n=1 Tax=Klebsiella pneumoniae TaxID=573 RepID=UPI0009837849